jgi:bla regulator protein BlaR1
MDILLKSFFLSIIFWIFYQLFLRKNTFFNWKRVYLLFGLLSIFIIPFVKIPIEVEMYYPSSGIF